MFYNWNIHGLQTNTIVESISCKNLPVFDVMIPIAELLYNSYTDPRTTDDFHLLISMSYPLEKDTDTLLLTHWDLVTYAPVKWFIHGSGNYLSPEQIQYIPRNMHTALALLCVVVVMYWLIYPYPSDLLHWHCGNLTIAPVPAKQPWWIWVNASCEFIMNDYITTTKQSTTKPCANFLGYTVNDSISCFQSQR